MDTVKDNTTYEDLVFRNKPKEYGGYQLRKNYTWRLLIATFLSLLLVFAVYLYPILAREKEDPNAGHLKIETKNTINYSQLSAPPPVEVEMIEAPQVALTEMPKIKTVKFLPPVVKPDEEVAEEELLPTQNELKKANIGTENIEGEDSLVNYYIPPNVNVEMPSEPVKVVAKPPPPPPPKEAKVYDFASKQAEFPGGGEAMRKFFAENVNYPAAEREFGMEARVFVQFVVERDGSISNPVILRSGGPAFDAEVMRVIRFMPNWIPGEHNGSPVRVRATIPVKFEMVE